ncbi:MAG: hypothetical protein ACLPN1_01630 [Dissulfurispiraceae bacterium]
MTDLGAGMKKFFFLALLLSIIGCTSMEKKVDEYGSSWISRPLSELKQEMKSPDSYASQIDWDETTYQLANGYYIFVEPFSKDCFIHWKINPKDTIIGYFGKGTGCSSRHETASDDSESVIETITKENQQGN